MPRITVVILSLNEADRIEQAIRSARFADEVLVLDAGSSDGTVWKAAEADRVVETDWPGFVAQRNRALDEATGDWVFFLDADERIDEAMARSIRACVEGVHAGYRAPRHHTWLGTPIHHGSFGPDAPVRLVEKGARCVGEGVHETLEVDGSIGTLSGTLQHDPYRDLGEHLATIDRYSALFAEHSTRRARLIDVVFRPPLHFVASFLLRRGFQDGIAGLQLAWLGSLHVLLKWSRRYVKQP
ncbi:MAG: glycosyltransferase family 2 protein [Proteobacteria bacterium]|nr:glycosyltransferase family 2 protein [Pseudomonadota bacterium]MCP4918252.1 glycosyltransferase family 2 protein [Pseudomonadota bacterium]